MATKKTAATKPEAAPIVEGAESAAEPVVKKPRVKRPRAVKLFAYQRISSDGVVGEVSEVFTVEKDMVDDIALTAGKEDTIVLFREYKRGKINTKVKIG